MRLLQHGISTVIDVGANSGDYGAELRAFGYTKQIISLEPVAVAFAELANRSARDGAWECHNVAAGNRDGEATINVASNLASSSLFAMRDEHRRGAPDVSCIGHERVRLQRLDSLALDIMRPTMLKIDVQGYEEEVLNGARETLAGVALVECELSIACLYEGQPSLRVLINRLGFEIVDLEPIFFEREAGRVLSVDGLFSRALSDSS